MSAELIAAYAGGSVTQAALVATGGAIGCVPARLRLLRHPLFALVPLAALVGVVFWLRAAPAGAGALAEVALLAVPLLALVAAARVGLPAFALTVALLAFTFFLITRTRYGFRLRAVTQNAEVARCFGINASRVYGLTFAYGAGLAGVAGALIGPLKSVSPDMGTSVVVDAFMVVVVGGVSSLLGTVASAGLLGEMSGLLAYLYNDTLAKALVFFAVVILIRFRPEGMFTVRVRRG